jgi:thioredoxin 1
MVLNDKNFQEIINSNELVLIDFFAEWCGPCKLMGPIIEGMAKEYNEQKDGKVKIGKLDVDEGKETAEKYNIMGVPTFAIFQNGKIVWQATGVQSRETLIEVINKYLDQ